MHIVKASPKKKKKKVKDKTWNSVTVSPDLRIINSLF